MKKRTLLPLLLAGFTLGLTAQSPAQTIIWSDDFNRADTTPDSLGNAVVGGTYTITAPGTRDVSISANRAYFDWKGTAGGDISDGIAVASVSYTGLTLASQPGLVTWGFNFENTGRNGPWPTLVNGSSGGIVLGATSSDFFSADGYAVLQYADTDGGSTSVRLVRFTGGVEGTITELVASTDTYSAGTETRNKVTFDPTTNTWTLFSEASSADPLGLMTSDGLIVDSTFTSSTFTSSGLVQVADAGSGTQGNRDAYLDNVSFTVVPEPSVGLLVQGSLLVLLLLRRRRR